jgi:uncharacterized protein (DUF2249 family)
MTTPNTPAPTDDIFDARELPCEVKRPAVIERCCQLQVGRSFVFINGHDPVPLRRHLDQVYPGCFRWEPLDSEDADSVRLRVTKISEPAGGFSAQAASFSCS